MTFVVEIPEFMTHAKMSKTKYLKINGQRLYSGLNPHVRSNIVSQMHTYVRGYIKDQLEGCDLSALYPLHIKLEFHAPINYGNVKMLKGEVRWKVPADNYEPEWDADNMWIWGKIFNDTLKEEGFIIDDNVKYISESGGVKFVETKDFDSRKLRFIISKSV